MAKKRPEFHDGSSEWLLDTFGKEFVMEIAHKAGCLPEGFDAPSAFVSGYFASLRFLGSMFANATESGLENDRKACEALIQCSVKFYLRSELPDEEEKRHEASRKDPDSAASES